VDQDLAASRRGLGEYASYRWRAFCIPMCGRASSGCPSTWVEHQHSVERYRVASGESLGLTFSKTCRCTDQPRFNGRANNTIGARASSRAWHDAITAIVTLAELRLQSKSVCVVSQDNYAMFRARAEFCGKTECPANHPPIVNAGRANIVHYRVDIPNNFASTMQRLESPAFWAIWCRIDSTT